MLASSWFDPVLGIDIHWEMVPMPAPVPTPIPNPFTGMIIDPAGLIGGMIMGAAMSAVLGAPFQGPVLYWSVIPSTNTGTNAKHIPGHILIPPGTMWAPVPRTPKPKIHPKETVTPAPPIKPENDATCVFGSKTVTVGGSNAVRLGDILLSCSEPVRLPSSVVLAISKGAPILIGGPPSLDLMAAVLASLRTRFVSDSLHALVSRLPFRRLRSALNRIVCFFTGHPVDVASGKMMTESVDAELPGPLPLKIERIYSSAFGERPGPLGHGWSLSLDQAIWTERGKVVLLSEDGREIEFDTFDLPGRRMAAGDELWHPIDRLTLKCKGHGHWQVVAEDGVTRDYAPVPGGDDGRAMIQRIRSRCGNHEIAFEYDKKGRLEWVRDACGRLVWLEHDENGRVSALKLPLPQGQGFYTHRKYIYDSEGDLVQVVDALNHSWRFEYVTHLLVKETDRTGLSFYFEYDGLGEDAWCVRTWGDGGIYDHKLSYDKVKKVTYVTNSLGHTTQYQMNLIGLVTKVIDPLGGETRYEYDPNTLQKTAEIDPLGNARRWEYDGRENCIRILGPDGGMETAEYDAQNRIVRAVAPAGGVWTWEYSRDLRTPIRARDARGKTTEYLPRDGLLEAIVDPLGARTEFEYDEQKNLTAMRDPGGAETRSWYDGQGRAIRRRGPGGIEQRARYDAEGRIVECREADGNVREYTRDPEGNLVRYRDALRDIKYGYTGFHKLAWQEEGGAVRRIEYDTEGRITGVVNEAGERHRFVLDPCDRLSAEEGFDGSTRRYQRDKAGRVILDTRPSGSEVKVAYDPAGRITALAYSDGYQEEFGYRPDGAMAWAANEAGQVEFQRDELGNVIQEARSGEVVRSRYDANGALETVESSFQARVSAIRNPAGAVTRLRMETWDIEFQRDAAGEEIERRLPGGLVARWGRDPFGRLAEHRVTAGERTLSARRYQWDLDDRLSAVLDAFGGVTRYGHDARGRLSWMERSDETRQYRVADGVGNLYRSQARTDREYGPGGRLRRADGTTYLHDADGNVIEKRGPDGKSWRYAWNAAGHLQEVTRPDGEKIRFRYDALGRRVAKQSSRGESRYVWNGDNLIHEISSAEGLTTWHHEPDSLTPVAKEQNGRHFAVIADHLGTPTEIYDEAGALAWRMQLDAFGVGRPDVALTSCPWRWPGQFEDPETGLYYNRFRYYDPEAGRYLSPDPTGLDGGFNRYTYQEDPFQTIDPLGLVSIGEIAPYGSAAHALDGLQAHELLQAAFLRARSIGNSGNPAMGLPQAVHQFITNRQLKSGFLGQTAGQNIAAGVKAIRAGVADALKAGKLTSAEAQAILSNLADFKKQAKEHAKRKGCA